MVNLQNIQPILLVTTLNTSPDVRLRVNASLAKVQSWVERSEYRGYEPFDGLSSVFRPLTCGNLMAQRVLMQLVRQSPINLRPILGISRKESTKGRGYMAWGYLYLHKATGDRAFLQKAEACLDWLDQHKVPRFKDHSWSNHFDFASRGGVYTKDDPIIVWTSLIGQAYLEAFEQTRNERWLRIAESACRWILALPRESTTQGSCLSYLSHVQSSIHNANMLGAALLARTASHTNDPAIQAVARSAMEYSCTRQLPDGSWWYAEPPTYRWIDNFHTGYNLDSLKCYIDYSGDSTWVPQLRAGLEYYKRHFFEESGRPRYYHNRTYPVDSQCAGQAIDTLALFSDQDPTCLPLACKVADWTMAHMQEPDGHFHYRHYPWGKAKTPMLHWSQGVIFKGLAVLALKLTSKPGGA
jgi:rhamnogalacturonyl hydrolase YesR